MGARFLGGDVVIAPENAAKAQSLIDADSPRKVAIQARIKSEIENAVLPYGFGKRIIYARGHPYGCPILLVRGGGTKTAKRWLQKAGFTWSGVITAWELQGIDRSGCTALFAQLQEAGYKVEPNAYQAEKGYVIDGFDGPNVG